MTVFSFLIFTVADRQIQTAQAIGDETRMGYLTRDKKVHRLLYP